MRFKIIAILLVALPCLSQARSKPMPKSEMPGGSNRPVATVPAPPPVSPECAGAKAYANGLRSEALSALNQAVGQASSKYSQLEINFYNCRQNFAQEAVSVAEISVCGGYLSQSQLQDKVKSNLAECDARRAAEKLAISRGLAPVKENQPIILTTPDSEGVRVPASTVEPKSSKGARALR